MSKCRKEIVQGAILKLISQITDTMPNSAYKFLLGGASTFATLKSTQKIDEILSYISDNESGLVDIDLLQKLVDGAFQASDGSVQVELFNNGGLINMFVKPLTLTIKKNDIDQLMNEIRQNCTTRDVVLSEKETEIKS